MSRNDLLAFEATPSNKQPNNFDPDFLPSNSLTGYVQPSAALQSPRSILDTTVLSGQKMDSFTYDEIIGFFNRPEDVDIPWLFQIRQNNAIQLQEITPGVMTNQIVFDNFDNIQCIQLEIQFQKYQRQPKNEQLRFVKLNLLFTVDFKQMIEFKDENPTEYRKLMRGVKKERPLGNKRFTGKVSYSLLNSGSYQPPTPPRMARIDP